MKPLYIFVLLLTISVNVFSQDKSRIRSAAISFNFENNDVDGTISGFSSSSAIDLQNLENSTFEGSVAVSTIKTGNFLRDWSLKSGKYFDADEHPRLTFKSTSVTPNENGFSVKGDLSIKGTTKPITIDFRKSSNQLIGTTTLFVSDYGINIKREQEQNRVTVKLAFEIQ